MLRRQAFTVIVLRGVFMEKSLFILKSISLCYDKQKLLGQYIQD